MQRYSFRFVILLATLLIGIGPGRAGADPGLDKARRLAEEGDITGALSAYRVVVQARPDWAEGYARLGGMQLVNQQYRDAVRSFQKAISLGDQGTQPFIGMGMAYLHMGEYGLARAAFGEAKARGAGHPEDIDRLLEWLDSGEAQVPQAHP
jgi:Flp pilus assembly protein TadD